MCILKILIANRRCKCCACSKHTLQRATSISRRHEGAKCECQMRLLLTQCVASLPRCVFALRLFMIWKTSRAAIEFIDWLQEDATSCFPYVGWLHLRPALYSLHCVCSWQAASWLNLTLAPLLWPVAAILLLLLLPLLLLLLLLLLPANI